MADQNSKANDVLQNIDRLVTLFSDYAEDEPKTIAERAKKAVIMYRVLASTGLQSLDLTAGINKYLETMYAIFTLIVVGIDPFVQNRKGDFFEVIGSESYSFGAIVEENVKRLSEEVVVRNSEDRREVRSIRIGAHKSAEGVNDYMNRDFVSNTYRSDGLDNVAEDPSLGNRKNGFPASGTYLHGINTRESDFVKNMDKRVNSAMPTIITINLTTFTAEISRRIENPVGRPKSSGMYNSPTGVTDINENTLKFLEDREKEKTIYTDTLHKSVLDGKITNADMAQALDSFDRETSRQMEQFRRRQYEEMEQNISSNSKFNERERYYSLNNSSMYSGRIPIAIKANCYPILSEELKIFIESVLNGKMAKALRYAKWKSGEIKTSTYLFKTDISKNNTQLFKKLNKNPWYMEFQSAKLKRSTGRFFRHFFPGFVELVKTINSRTFGKGDKVSDILSKEIPPTGSLVVTYDDLEVAMRIDPKRYFSNIKNVRSFMDEAYIMCLAIADMSNEVVDFYFMGYSNPFTVPFKELMGGKDKETQLYEAINTLARRV